jgi:hypothetical protein
MKKVKSIIGAQAERLEKKWERLSVQRQRKIIKYSFLGYVFLTLLVFVQACFGTRQNIPVTHIPDAILPYPKSATAPKGDSLLFHLNQLKKAAYDNK